PLQSEECWLASNRDTTWLGLGLIFSVKELQRPLRKVGGKFPGLRKYFALWWKSLGRLASSPPDWPLSGPGLLLFLSLSRLLAIAKSCSILMFVCGRVSGANRGQKNVSDPLALVLQMVALERIGYLPKGAYVTNIDPSNTDLLKMMLRLFLAEQMERAADELPKLHSALVRYSNSDEKDTSYSIRYYWSPVLCIATQLEIEISYFGGQRKGKEHSDRSSLSPEGKVLMEISYFGLSGPVSLTHCTLSNCLCLMRTLGNGVDTGSLMTISSSQVATFSVAYR
ncbi:hypothetical protein STEG23_037136, partial [Scotinomys teguina]